MRNAQQQQTTAPTSARNGVPPTRTADQMPMDALEAAYWLARAWSGTVRVRNGAPTRPKED